MKKLVLLAAILVVVSTAAFAQSGDINATAVDVAGDNPTAAVNATPIPQATLSSPATIRKPVKKSLDLDALTANDWRIINEASRKHVDKKVEENNDAYRNGNILLRQMNVIHPSEKGTLDRPPNDIHNDYQIITETIKRLNLSYEMPAFNCGPPQGSLALDEVPYPQQARSVCSLNPGTSFQFDHPGSTTITPIATVGVFKIPNREIVREEVKPPDDGTCGPGTPPAKPPTNGPVGDPSGPEPNPNLPPGYVAPGGPPPPTGDQAPVVIPHQPWDPTPTNPHVADPVIPGQ